MKHPLPLRLLLAALAGAACLSGAGCATQSVPLWQRATLTDYIMKPDRDLLASTLDEHVWFSREASSGGRGVRGAGCGCN